MTTTYKPSMEFTTSEIAADLDAKVARLEAAAEATSSAKLADEYRFLIRQLTR